MKVVFLTNTYNHHQAPLAEELYKLFGDDFCFIQTMPMTLERKQLGWSNYDIPSFVRSTFNGTDADKECKKTIYDSDVVIIGSASNKWIAERIKRNKLTFRYSERIYKNKKKILSFPVRFLKYHWENAFSRNTYLLCASAYAAADYAKTGNFIGKAFKWGYFPEVKKYDSPESLIAAKKTASILWVARLIDWKHPEIPIEIAKRLKLEGYRFTLDIIGSGILENRLKAQIRLENLDDCVHMLGSMKPEQVREYMEQSEIFLFTSDRNEGWGAVLNESMNSACAVVASHAIGSVPFLIEDGKNGLIYQDGNLDDLYRKVKYLLEHEKERRQISINAYETMVTEWNAENAADKFIRLVQSLLNGEKHPNVSTCGVCSEADILSDDWYKNK